MFIQSIHTIILVLIIIISFLIKTPLYQYDLFFVLMILLIYWIIKNLFKLTVLTHRLTDAVVFTMLIIIIVNSTGGLYSPLFFLIYCLIFGLSLLLEPFVSFFATITLILLYLLNVPAQQPLSTLLPLLSLAFICPFAVFLGEEYQKILEQKKDIIILKKRNEDLQIKIKHLIKQYDKK